MAMEWRRLLITPANRTAKLTLLLDTYGSSHSGTSNPARNLPMITACSTEKTTPRATVALPDVGEVCIRPLTCARLRGNAPKLLLPFPESPMERCYNLLFP